MTRLDQLKDNPGVISITIYPGLAKGYNRNLPTKLPAAVKVK